MELQLYIDGIGNVTYTTTREYVSGDVAAAYLNYMNILQTVLNKTVATDSDYNDLYTAIEGLKNLSQNGAKTNGATFYMTYEMAQNLNIILQYLQVANIPTERGTGSTELAQQYLDSWDSIKGFGAGDALTRALNVDTNTRSLQSMIELEYVKQGNELIAANLSKLEQSLETIQGVLDQLQTIQTIANNMAVTSPTGFTFPPNDLGDIPSAAIQALINLGVIGNPPYQVNGKWYSLDYIYDLQQAGAVYGGISSSTTNNSYKLTGETTVYDSNTIYYKQVSGPTSASALASQTKFASAIKAYINANSAERFTAVYKIIASAYFAQIKPVPQGTEELANSLLAAKSALINYITQIETQNAQQGLSVDRTTINTLPYFLNKVVQDIQAAFSSNFGNPVGAVNQWILDNQDKSLSSSSNAVSTSGAIQTNLTQAINTAEDLNETKKQEVSNYMFIFQEFYKSSASILQKISQMVERMAQTISQ